MVAITIQIISTQNKAAQIFYSAKFNELQRD
jgi:hypothetical protein